MSKNTNIVKDSRDETLQNLMGFLNDALRASLIAQLCARGKSLKEAIEDYQQLTDDQIKTLIKPDGGSGYLDFQWISESILKTRASVSAIDLHDFWEFVRAGKNTRNVYESHLEAALQPINDTTSGIKKNLNDLYENYPGNKVTSESLPILRQIQEATNKIEKIIQELLVLSPPARRKTPRVSRSVVITLFVFSLLSIPLFYWLGAATDDNITEVSSKIERDISAIKQTAEEAPTNLPKLIFTEMVPLFSNILLLISVAIGLIRAFSRDSLKDTKRMSEELTKAAKLLRELG